MSTKVSKHFPRDCADALRESMGYATLGPRIAAINRVTDHMAARGLVRPRTDTSRAAEWQAQRDAAAVVQVAKGRSAPKTKR